MKKILALIMAVLLIICMASCSKDKEEETEATTPLGVEEDVISSSVGTFSYGINAAGEYEITDYTPASVAIVDITLPKETPDGRELTSIGENAFKAENTIKSVTIPETYAHIGKYAFYDCDSLISVVMADSIVDIAEGAFQACDQLGVVTMSKAVKTVGQNAFKDCVALEAIDMSGAVESIGTGAFMGCTSLKNVQISDKITSIEKYSFMGAASVVYTVEGGAKYLGNAANPYLVLVEAENLNIKECTVNNNTKVIAKAALANCSSLEKVTLGAAVTVVDGECFTNSPVKYTEYANIKYLGTAENPHMVAIDVILVACENLAFHENVQMITVDALDGCYELKTISYPKTEADWNNIAKAEGWSGDLVLEYFYSTPAVQ